MTNALPIVGDSSSEFRDSQKALLNILEDLHEEKKNAEDGTRALINILEDLREEKIKTEQAVAKDEALLASIGDGVIAVDSQGNITLINQAAASMLGLEGSTIFGKRLVDSIAMIDESGTIVPSEKRPITSALTATKTTIVATVATAEPQYQYVRKDGSQFPVAMTVTPVILDGNIIGAISIFRDITQERRVDRAKSEFMSLASHQLRTPLTGIRWSFGRLEKMLLGSIDPKAQRMLRQGRISAENMSSTIDTMLQIARIESGQMQLEKSQAPLTDLLEQVLSTFRDECRTRCQSLTVLCPKNLSLPTDPKLLKEILENLLSNAVKYTPAGGLIHVNVKKRTQDIVIEVRDSGYGIPAHQQNKIFTRFFRGDNVVIKDTKGTGLGLYLVMHLVKLLEAEISFVSKEGKGTTFTISLPFVSHA